MNKKFSVLCVFVATLFVALTSCNNSEKANLTEVSDAQEVSVEAGGQDYHIDGDNSQIFWEGNKPVGGGHNGRIPISVADLQIEGDKILSGYFEFDLNNIINDDLEGETAEMLVNHLKSEDFFDVAKYPKGEFRITGSEFLNESSDTCLISGNLKLKDIEKNISFKANISKEGNKYNAVTETFAIDRTLWGVNYQSKNIVKNLKDGIINDEIIIRIELSVTNS